MTDKRINAPHADSVVSKLKQHVENVFFHPLHNFVSSVRVKKDTIRLTIDLPRDQLGIEDARSLDPRLKNFDDLKLIPVITFIDAPQSETPDKMVDAKNWVATSSELPEQNEGCLLFTKHSSRLFIGWASYWQPKNEFAGFTFTHEDFEEHSNSITHWLQLPETPNSSDEWNNVEATPPTDTKTYLVWIGSEDAFGLADVTEFNEDGSVKSWNFNHPDFAELEGDITHWIELPELP
ncbi:DUF551 domain-containing protein [Vibrio crassostreae]|uniref:DUF551 domain-containing protein n=1 Tax=Vibrio crassostreae TaxID=246167 RepID=UPI001B30BA3D|nr:DUF551 domain-containing protein [Vibrio crassostreae]